MLLRAIAGLVSAYQSMPWFAVRGASWVIMKSFGSVALRRYGFLEKGVTPIDLKKPMALRRNATGAQERHHLDPNRVTWGAAPW